MLARSPIVLRRSHSMMGNKRSFTSLVKLLPSSLQLRQTMFVIQNARYCTLKHYKVLQAVHNMPNNHTDTKWQQNDAKQQHKWQQNASVRLHDRIRHVTLCFASTTHQQRLVSPQWISIKHLSGVRHLIYWSALYQWRLVQMALLPYCIKHLQHLNYLEDFPKSEILCIILYMFFLYYLWLFLLEKYEYIAKWKIKINLQNPNNVKKCYNNKK